MTTLYPEKFDKKTFEGQENKLSVLQEDFEDLIREDNYFRQRYNRIRSERLRELFNSQLEKNIKLHPGFQK
jgi:hypothetical protein